MDREFVQATSQLPNSSETSLRRNSSARGFLVGNTTRG